MKTGGDLIEPGRRELNIPAAGGGTMVLAGVGLAFDLVLGRSGFSLDSDSVDLLDLESTDLMLLTTFEYDLVMGLVSLNGYVLWGSLMVGLGGCRWMMDGWR